LRKKFTDEFGECVITGFIGVDLHHWKSRGSGGTNGDHNLLALKHELHNELHLIGRDSFINKKEHYKAKEWLINNGWYLFNSEWFHPKEHG